jgi:hypothetical protein
MFPVHAVTGPAYVRDLLAPMPDLPLFATGGVTLEDVRPYAKAGARAVAVGSALFGDDHRCDGRRSSIGAVPGPSCTGSGRARKTLAVDGGSERAHFPVGCCKISLEHVE